MSSTHPSPSLQSLAVSSEAYTVVGGVGAFEMEAQDDDTESEE